MPPMTFSANRQAIHETITLSAYYLMYKELGPDLLQGFLEE